MSYLRVQVLCITLLLISVILGCSQADGQKVQPRIVGGQATTQSAVGGYVVNLRNNGRFTCGGSLVTPLYVVTAAHCVYGISANRLTVQGGVTMLSQPGVVRQVTRVNVPSAYRSNSMNMDVAVLRLESAMQGNNIATIPLCSVQWRVGSYMRVSGWGATRYGNRNNPTQLRTVQLQLISKDVCQRMYGGRNTIPASSFCARSSGKDACTGDSGGGAIYNNQLCGVVSAGQGCANARYPGIYTSIQRARSFINGVINN